MALSGQIGRLAIKLLTQSSVFNKNFVVVKFGDTFKIFKSKPKDQLRKINITPKNILSLKFDYYEAFRLLDEYVAQINKHDFQNRKLLIDVWDNEQMQNLIRRFELVLADTTNDELKVLLDKKVFKEKHGTDYKYFITVFLHPDIKNSRDNDRRFAKGALKYSLRPEHISKELRMKAKFSLTTREAKDFFANIAYWKDEADTSNKSIAASIPKNLQL